MTVNNKLNLKTNMSTGYSEQLKGILAKKVANIKQFSIPENDSFLYV